MHVLLVHVAPVPVFGYGGTERVVWDLGRALVALGHRVSFLVPEGSHCDFAEVHVLRPGQPWEAQLPPGVDVVHFQFDPGREPDFPYLVTEHGNSKTPHPLPRNTVFVSMDHARRHGSAQFVRNGLDWSAYGPVDLSARRAGLHFLGKAAWRLKNVQGAIDVARAGGETLEVLGGTRLNLRRGFRLTLSPRVHFHGMVGGAEKFRLLGGSRGFVFPVRWHEPFGLAVIESLYFGAPVFATPYGALPELVPEELGVLSASREVLAEAVRARRFDPAACHAWATERFGAGRMARDYLLKYEAVTSGERLHAEPPTMQGPYDGLAWGP